MENLSIQNLQTPQSANVEQQEKETTISLRDIVFIVLNNWYWFAASLIICLAVSAVVYKTKPKIYGQTSTIMVRDNEGTMRYQSRNMDAIFNSMGMEGGMQSISNEIYLLQSSSLMKNVVKRLNLNNTCSRNSLFTKISYYTDRPVQLKVFNQKTDKPEVNIAMEVTPLDMSKYEYKVTRLDDKKLNMKGTALFTEPVNVSDDVSFTVDKTANFKTSDVKVKFDLAECPVKDMAYRVMGRLSVSRVDKMASIIAISYTDNNDRRAKEVVDVLVDVYNEDAVNDKNKVAEKTDQFVSERIALIMGELEDVDTKVERIKKSTGMPDIQGASGALISNTTRYTDEVVSLETERQLIVYIRDYMNNPAYRDELLPANVGISDGGVQGMINQYNSQLLQYRKLLNNDGPNNPQVRNLTQQM